MSTLTRNATILELVACAAMLIAAWAYVSLSDEGSSSPRTSDDPVPDSADVARSEPASPSTGSVPPPEHREPRADTEPSSEAPARQATRRPLWVSWQEAPRPATRIESLQRRLVPFSTRGGPDAFARFKTLAPKLGPWQVVAWLDVEAMEREVIWAVVCQGPRGQLWVLQEREGLGAFEVLQTVDLPKDQVWTGLVQEARDEETWSRALPTVLVWDAAHALLRRVHLFKDGRLMTDWYEAASAPVQDPGDLATSPMRLELYPGQLIARGANGKPRLAFPYNPSHARLGLPTPAAASR